MLNQAEGTGLGTQAYDSKSRDAFVQVTCMDSNTRMASQ